jgi:hypothetical protein
MGGEKFDSPQPESFLFGENSGKYPQQVHLNIWPFLMNYFRLHLAKGSSLQFKSELLLFFSKSFSGEIGTGIIVMNYFSLSFIECFFKLCSFSLKNLITYGTA